VARVAALVPDLMFASKVKALLERGGHEVELVAGGDVGAGAEVLVVDLVSAGPDGLAMVERVRDLGVPALATYSHVDADTRARARAAGFDLVVPRSRMMREGADLVSGLIRP
jgi:CheY-like chemotaxis protein